MSSRIAIAAGYATAAQPLNVAPLMIGGLVTYLGLSEAEAGGILTLELIGMSVVAFLLAPFGETLLRNAVAPIGCGLILIGTGLTLLLESTTAIAATRLISGIGCGCLLLAANVLIAKSASPVRNYGIAVTSSVAMGVGLLIIMPFSTERFGLAGTYGPLFVIAVLCLPLVLRTHSSEQVSSENSGANQPIGKPLLLWIVAGTIFVIQFAQAAYYAMAERRGIELDLEGATIGALLAAAYASSLASTTLATWIDNRWRLLKPLLAGLLGHLLFAVMVLTTEDRGLYSFAIVGQSICYFFAVPFQLSVAAHLDPSGRFASAATGLFFLGLALGPALGGHLVGNYSFAVLAQTISVATLLSLAVIAYILKKESIA